MKKFCHNFCGHTIIYPIHFGSYREQRQNHPFLANHEKKIFCRYGANVGILHEAYLSYCFSCDYGTSRLANFFFLKPKWGVIFDKAFNLRLAFLHMSSTWALKESSESILTPKSLSCVLCLFPYFQQLNSLF